MLRTPSLKLYGTKPTKVVFESIVGNGLVDQPFIKAELMKPGRVLMLVKLLTYLLNRLKCSEKSQRPIN